MNRELATAVRRFADANSERIAEVPTIRFVATVVTTSPLTISWRGSTFAADRNRNYTPVIGDRVMCDYTDSQPVVDYPIA